MQDNMVRSTSSIGWLLLIGGIVIGGGVAIFACSEDGSSVICPGQSAEVGTLCDDGNPETEGALRIRRPMDSGRSDEGMGLHVRQADRVGVPQGVLVYAGCRSSSEKISGVLFC